LGAPTSGAWPRFLQNDKQEVSTLASETFGCSSLVPFSFFSTSILNNLPEFAGGPRCSWVAEPDIEGSKSQIFWFSDSDNENHSMILEMDETRRVL
jgi:hypothetical protein